MEELLIVIFQFVSETVLEALLYWPFESATDRMLVARPADAERRAFPLRIANLAVAPLISAGIAWLIARHRVVGVQLIRNTCASAPGRSPL